MRPTEYHTNQYVPHKEVRLVVLTTSLGGTSPVVFRDAVVRSDTECILCYGCDAFGKRVDALKLYKGPNCGGKGQGWYW